MITVNEWRAGGNGGGVNVQSMGEMGKDFCTNFLQRFLENIDRRSCNYGNRELIPVFHNPHRKCRPSPSVVARTLEYHERVPSKAASSGRKEKQVRKKFMKINRLALFAVSVH